MSESKTQIADVLIDRIEIKGRDLVSDLIGHYTYTEMIFFLLRNQFPTQAQTRVLDAVLVTLMEHGLTPSALIARLAAHSVPADVQVAMAAGLLSVGSVFAGTMEDCAKLLKQGIDSGEDAEPYCNRIVLGHRDRKLNTKAILMQSVATADRLIIVVIGRSLLKDRTPEVRLDAKDG